MWKKNYFLNHFIWLLLLATCLGACHTQDGGSADNSARDSLFNSARLKKMTDSIRQYPDSARLYFERGGMLYMMKEFDLAGKDIKKAIELDPVKADYYTALGEIYLAGDQYQPAQNAFQMAVGLDPADVLARLQLSYTLLQNKNYRATINQTDTLIKSNPTLAEAYGLQSQAYSALKDTARAMKLMTKAVAFSPKNYDVLMAMGDLLMNAKDSSALAYYRRAQKADTTQAEPLFCIGLFYASRGDTDKAITAYQNCISRDAYYLDGYLKLGKIYQTKDNWEKALKVYILATEIAPKSSAAFYERGICYEKMSQPQKALNDYENAYSLEKNNGKAAAAVARLRADLTSQKKH